MGTVMTVRPWMVGRDGHVTDCVNAAERSQNIGAQLTSLETEETALIGELNSPGFRQRRHQAAGAAIADGLKPDDSLPDIRGRLRAIAEEKPGLSAALRVLEERYSKALTEAKAELAKELRPKYVELLKPMVSAAIDLLTAAEAERQFRDPLRMQDVTFSGHLQGLPYGGAQPDGQLIIWLRRVDRHYPEIGVRKLAEKKGVEL